MEKIEFLVGDQGRFLKFISTLNEEDRVALISHSKDIDGIVSAKVVNAVVNAVLIKFVNYDEVNNHLIETLKKDKINKIIITDLGSDNLEFFKELEKFSEVLIIDHHTFTEDLNSDRTVFLNAKGYCAAYLCYYLFSRMDDMQNLDWLVAIASVSDWLYEKNERWVKNVYEKHGDELVLENKLVKQEGEMWQLLKKIYNSIMYFNKGVNKVFDNLGEEFGDIGELGKYSDEIQKEIDLGIENYQKVKEVFNGRNIFIFKPKFPVGAVISSILSVSERNKSLLIIEDKGESYHVHARRQDGEENMAILVKRLVDGLEHASGGGHIPAAGAHFLKKDLDIVKKRLKEF